MLCLDAIFNFFKCQRIPDEFQLVLCPVAWQRYLHSLSSSLVITRIFLTKKKLQLQIKKISGSFVRFSIE